MGGSEAAGLEGIPPQVAGAKKRVAPAPLPFAFSLAILFLTYWCVDIVAPALPAIRDSLALTATSAGLVFSVFFAGRLATNIPAAWLVERAGPKWTAVAGSAVLLAGSLLAATAASQPVLLAARGVQGAGVAVLATAGLLSALRARPERGAAMTAFNLASGIGGSGGLLAGGFLTTEIGWRAIFWLSSAVSGLLLAGSVLVRGEKPKPLARSSPEQSAPIAERSVTGAAAAVAGNLLVFANYAIWVVSLPLLAAVKFGFDGGQVGLLLLYVNIVHVASALPAGRAIRVAGGARALAVGFGVSGLGLLLVPLVPAAVWLAAPMALYAIGQATGNSAAGDLILRLGGGGGRAVGAVRLSADVGLVIGPALAGLLADAAGVEAPFVALGVLALAAMGITALVGWRKPRLGWGQG